MAQETQTANDDLSDTRYGSEDEARRHLEELLQEIRIALPGVEILFGFLLTIAFSERFVDLDALSRDLHLAALVLSAVSCILLIAPTAFHRLQHGNVRVDVLIRDATVLSILGTTTMGAAFTAATYFVVRFVYSSTVAAPIAGGIGGFIVVLWFVIPLARRFSANVRT